MKTKNHNKQERIAKLINLAIIECLQSGKFLGENLNYCPITITKVTITPDNKTAFCYFVPFNTKLSPEEILEALNNSSYILRKFVANRVRLKYCPIIKYSYDHSIDAMYQIDEIFEKISSQKNQIDDN